MLPSPLIWLASLVLAAVAMEGWAALLHRCIWHGALWPVHRTHHTGRGDIATGPSPPTWQLNDALSLTHAPIAVCLILYGCRGPAGYGREICYGVGIGMSVFGLAYVLVHDGLAHNRLPVRLLLKWPYLRRVRATHLLHHRTGGPPFGLFSAPTLLRRKHSRKAPGRRISKDASSAL